MSNKNYRCKECGHAIVSDTNHKLEFYSVGHLFCCPSCPPYKKYSELGGGTVWLYVSEVTRRETQA